MTEIFGSLYPPLGMVLLGLGCLFGLLSVVFLFAGHGEITLLLYAIGMMLIVGGGALHVSSRRSENILIKPVVVSELKFRDVERHIFSADLVIAADDSALEDRPEALNRIGVDRAVNFS